MKKEELKRVAVEKVGGLVLNEHICLHGYPYRYLKAFLKKETCLHFPTSGKQTEGESRGGCQTEGIKESGTGSEVWKICFTILKADTNGQFSFNTFNLLLCMPANWQIFLDNFPW